MKREITIAHVTGWIYRSRLPRRIRETAIALMLSLPWQGLDTGNLILDSRCDAKYPDKGITISYIAQQCSSAPRANSSRPATDTGRTQHRALHGGKRGKKKDGTLRDDGMSSLTELGIVTIHPRIGLPSHYTMDVGKFRPLAEKAQRKVVEHVDAREIRNGDLAPGAEGYEPPWTPELPDHAALLEAGDASRETTTNELGEAVDTHGIPLWVPELQPGLGSRAEFWQAIRTVAMELWPDHDGRDAFRRRGQLVKPLLHVFRSPDWRGSQKQPSWARLTTDVLRYIRMVRTCHNPSIMMRFRGWQRGFNGKWSQANKDWTLPANINVAKLIKPARICEVLLIAEVHDEQGPCGCQHNKLPLGEPELEAEVTAETILLTLDGPATTETDAAGLWHRMMVRLRDVFGRKAKLWLTPAEPRRIEAGVLVVAVPNHFYAEWMRDNDVASHLDVGVVFVTGPPKEA